MSEIGFFRFTCDGNWNPSALADFGTVEIAIPYRSKLVLVRAVELRDMSWPMKWATLNTLWTTGEVMAGEFHHNLATWAAGRRLMFNLFVMLIAQIIRALPQVHACYRSQNSPLACIFTELCHHDRTALACANREFSQIFKCDTELSPRIRRLRSYLAAVDEVYPEMLLYESHTQDLAQVFDIAISKPSDVVELAEWWALCEGRTMPYAFATRKGKREYPKPLSQLRRSDRLSKRRKPSSEE